MSTLEFIDFSGQNIAGPIQTEIGLMTNLELLDYSSNSLTGEIPTEIGLLTNLTELLPYRNSFIIGSIPKEVTALTLIKDMRWNNMDRLSGSIPTELGLMTQLTSIDLSRCNLTGLIPSELGLLTKLKELLLHYNQKLSGTVPDAVCALSRRRTSFRVNNCASSSANDFTSEYRTAGQNLRHLQQGGGASSNSGNDRANERGLVFCPSNCRCLCQL